MGLGGWVHSAGECKGISWLFCVTQISSSPVLAWLLPDKLLFSVVIPAPIFHSSCLSICLSICLLCFVLHYSHAHTNTLTHKFDSNPPCSSLITSPRINNVNPILHLLSIFSSYLFIHFISFSPGTRRSWGAGNGAAMELLPKGGNHIKGRRTWRSRGVSQKREKTYIISQRLAISLLFAARERREGVPGVVVLVVLV